MFQFLKDKLKNWTKSLVKDSEEQAEKEVKPTKEKAVETRKPKEKKKSLKPEKAEAIVEEIIKEFEPEKDIISQQEETFDIYADELESLLLENNVALEVAEKIVFELREKIVGQELLRKEIESEIHDSLKEIIERILVEPFDLIQRVKEKKEKPFVILFCGINGTGKTTTIAKIAESFKKQGLRCVLAAADTFRAASIEQIKKHGERLKVPVISHEYGSDPASVGFDAISYAKKHNTDVVLIDTAGRMHTEKNLLKELEKISKVCKPDCKIFVGESITGNDAVEQVKSFDWALGIDGIILSKADIDEKGGTALSVGYVTKKPILYLGTGQDYDAIEPFNKKKFIERLGL